MKIKSKKSKAVLFAGAVVVIAGIFFAHSMRSAAADFLFRKGNNYFGGGAYNLETAQKFYTFALAIDSNIEGPHYQLARIEFLRGNFPAALSEINKEIKNHPDFKRSYYVRGLINGYAKNYADAESDFKEFLDWDPRSWAAHNDLAWVYFSAGDYKNSAAVAKEGLEYSPNNPWLLNSYGVSLLNLGKKKEAAKAFDDALAAAKDLTPADWQRAYPGNDPGIAEEALKAMIDSIEANQKLSSAR